MKGKSESGSVTVSLTKSAVAKGSKAPGKEKNEKSHSDTSSPFNYTFTNVSLEELFSQVKTETTTETTATTGEDTKTETKAPKKSKRLSKAKRNKKSEDMANLSNNSTEILLVVSATLPGNASIKCPDSVAQNRQVKKDLDDETLPGLTKGISPAEEKTSFQSKTFAQTAGIELTKQKSETQKSETQKEVHKKDVPKVGAKVAVPSKRAAKKEPQRVVKIVIDIPQKETPEAWAQVSAPSKVIEKVKGSVWQTQGRKRKVKISPKVPNDCPEAWTKVSSPIKKSIMNSGKTPVKEETESAKQTTPAKKDQTDKLLKVASAYILSVLQTAENDTDFDEGGKVSSKNLKTASSDVMKVLTPSHNPVADADGFTLVDGKKRRRKAQAKNSSTPVTPPRTPPRTPPVTPQTSPHTKKVQQQVGEGRF